MQRIFKCCGIQNIILTPDKELNILTYRTPSYVIIWKSYTLLKMVQFFGPPCIIQIKYDPKQSLVAHLNCGCMRFACYRWKTSEVTNVPPVQCWSMWMSRRSHLELTKSIQLSQFTAFSDRTCASKSNFISFQRKLQRLVFSATPNCWLLRRFASLSPFTASYLSATLSADCAKTMYPGSWRTPCSRKTRLHRHSI